MIFYFYMKPEAFFVALSPKEIRHFYTLWMPILTYVNERYNIVPGFVFKMNQSPTHVTGPVAMKLRSNPELINDYLAREGYKLRPQDRQAVQEFTHYYSSRFAIHCYRGRTAYFIDEKSRVFEVHHLMSDWKELCYPGQMPAIATVGLLPYKGVIIHDGLFLRSFDPVEPEIKEKFKAIYEKAVLEKTIIQKLDGSLTGDEDE